MFDTTDLKSTVDPLTVAQGLGLKTKKTGKHWSILCPEHDDKHFGSCVLTKRGYCCYACGARGDIVKLAQVTLGCGFREAVAAIADIGGTTVEDDDTIERITILSESEQELIGLHNDPVKVVHTCGLPREVDDTVEVILDNPERGTVAELKCICGNPLRELRKTDEEAYNDVIVSLCEAAIEKRRDMKDALLNPISLPPIEDATETAIHKWFIGDIFKRMQIDVTQREISEVLDSEIQKIQKIAKRHGWKPNPISEGAKLGRALLSSEDALA